MDDDEKKAALDVLAKKGPWDGSLGGRLCQRWELTGGEVRAYYAAIAGGVANPCEAIGCRFASNRKVDRANSLLKRAGLIRYNGKSWEAM